VLVSVVVQLQSSPAINKLSSRRSFIVSTLDNWGNLAFFATAYKEPAFSSPPLGVLTNFRTFAGKTTLPEPWEVGAHVCYAPKTKSLNRLGANVRDRFFNRIRRINQL
jgi:hypothetical protein